MMKKKFSLVSRPFSACLAIFCFIILFASCNNQHEPVKSMHHDWVNFSIKFKPATSEAIRDAALKAIEKMLMDTLAVLKKGSYSHFNPSVCITKGLFGDSLNYNFSIGSRNEWGEISMADTSDVNDPKCPCKNGCRLCLMTPQVEFMLPFCPGGDSSRKPVSAFIESFNSKD